MKKAKIYVDSEEAGVLEELEKGSKYRFLYLEKYQGPSVSLEMPTSQKIYEFDSFPPFFEGVLPEGIMLDGLLKQTKIDKNDFMSQLIMVGGDLVGNVTVVGIE